MKDKNKSTLVKRIQQRENYSAMAEARYVPPDYVRIAYYGSSLCPDPNYRSGHLSRKVKPGETPAIKNER